MQSQKHVDCSQSIDGTHELELHVPRQIAQMDGVEFAECEEGCNGLRIFCVVVSALESCTLRIRLAAAGQWIRDDVSSRRDYCGIETGDREFVSGLRDSVLRLAVKLGIDILQKVIGRFCRLDVRAMINELLDRDMRSQFRQAAEMIAVPVCDDQMIDL